MNRSELDDFLQELDEDVEGMQSTILYLQQELKLAKETITSLERENFLLKNGNGGSASGNNCACSNNGMYIFMLVFKCVKQTKCNQYFDKKKMVYCRK